MPIQAIVPRVGESVQFNHGDYGWLGAYITDTPEDKAVDDKKRKPYVHLLFRHPSDDASASWAEVAADGGARATFVTHGLGGNQWCYAEELEKQEVVPIETPEPKVEPEEKKFSGNPVGVKRDMKVELEEVGFTKRNLAQRILKIKPDFFSLSGKKISEFTSSELKGAFRDLT